MKRLIILTMLSSLTGCSMMLEEAELALDRGTRNTDCLPGFHEVITEKGRVCRRKEDNKADDTIDAVP